VKLNTHYDSAIVKSPAIQEIVEIWRYRDLLKLLIMNSIKTRYRRSALGVVWTLLNPLLNTLVLTIVFSKLFRFDIENFPVYLLVGLLVWNFFAQTTTQAMNTLIWGSNLIKRIYVPRTIFAVSVAGNGIINFLLALISLAIIIIFTRHPLTPAIFLLPVAILILTMFTLGFALLMSTLAVFFVDIVDMFGILLSVWFYLTPIFYPISVVPQEIKAVVEYNPITLLLSLFRSSIYQGVFPDPGILIGSLVISIATLIIGWLVFTRKVDEFAYRI
jgi:ABC-type polysaccharide/polyol phosphate export permease